MQTKYLYLQKIKNLPSVLFEKMVPMDKTETLTYWRARILFSIIFPGVLIGLFVFIFSIPILIKQNLWNLVVSYGSALLIGICLLLFPCISFTIRATTTLLILYGIGLTIMVFTGPLSGGPLWLFCFSIFSGILLGSRAALVAILTNTITLAIIGYFIINSNWEIGRASCRERV